MGREIQKKTGVIMAAVYVAEKKKYILMDVGRQS